MNMIRLDGQFVNVPAVHFAAFVEEGGETSDKLSLEYSSAVLWYKYHMIHHMTASPAYRSGHSFHPLYIAMGGACAAVCQLSSTTVQWP